MFFEPEDAFNATAVPRIPSFKRIPLKSRMLGNLGETNTPSRKETE